MRQKVYEYLRTIPKGKVVTYGQIAEYLGDKHLARVVGNILHENPDESKYPCYKVVNAKGELSKAFVFGGENRQIALLQSEGVELEGNRVDLSVYRWNRVTIEMME